MQKGTNLTTATKGFIQHHFREAIMKMFNNFKFNKKSKHAFRLNGESGAGFTIIELLVVVAIIAVLTGIVLTNTTQYINKGKDSAVQGSLSSLSTNAAVYFDNNGNYTSLCTDATAATPLAAADKAFDGNETPNEVTDCNGAATEWAACGQLKLTDSYFCVDSTGTKKTIATRTTCVTAWAITACP